MEIKIVDYEITKRIEEPVLNFFLEREGHLNTGHKETDKRTVLELNTVIENALREHAVDLGLDGKKFDDTLDALQEGYQRRLEVKAIEEKGALPLSQLSEQIENQPAKNQAKEISK